MTRVRRNAGGPSGFAGQSKQRNGAVAIEFAVICPILFLIFLGMVEVSRGIMVAGAMNNAARIGARAGTVTAGTYTSITTSVSSSLANVGLPQSATIVVMVNNVEVTNDISYQTLAVPGATVSVQVSLPYGNVSWLPSGATVFVPSSQPIAGACVMTKEG